MGSRYNRQSSAIKKKGANNRPNSNLESQRIESNERYQATDGLETMKSVETTELSNFKRPPGTATITHSGRY